MKRFFAFVLCLVIVASLISCSGSSGSNAKSDTVNSEIVTDADGNVTIEDYKYAVTDEKTDNVLFTMSNGGRILIELYPDIAPETVENFKNLVDTKFYDGIIFHRVVKGFVIQAGVPTGTGYSGSDKKINGEFKLNGFDNNLSHDVGVLSMARRASDPNNNNFNSATSQFFIVTSERAKSSLDGMYAGFGKVIAGMSTVYAIEGVETDPKNDKPLVDQTIISARFVELK